MIEFDVDMGYALENGELEQVVLHDENGEHEDVVFVPKKDREPKATEAVQRFIKRYEDKIGDCHCLMRDMLMALVLALSGNGDPAKLHKQLEDFTERMEHLGAIDGDAL